MRTALSAFRRSSAPGQIPRLSAPPIERRHSSADNNSQPPPPPKAQSKPPLSKATSELAKQLTSALEEIEEFQVDLHGAPKDHFDSLDAKAATFDNASLEACSSTEPWKCNRDTAELVGIAWDCAANVYDETVARLSHESDYEFKSQLRRTIDGSIKQASFTVVSRRLPPRKQNAEFETLLAISIRGSATLLDHVIHLNSEQKDLSLLFEQLTDVDVERTFGVLKAHAGFVDCAIKIKEIVKAHIRAFLVSNPAGRVLFTGHSTGGAVASLLHLYFSMRYPSSSSCITFGSPPVASFPATPSIDPTIRHLLSAAEAATLNLINEFDFVTRADTAYLASILALLADKRAAPPEGKGAGGNSKAATWPLPPAELTHIGAVIALRTHLPASRKRREREGEVLLAGRVAPEELGGVLFCRLDVHKRVCYAERVQMVVNGEFNGSVCWPDSG